MILDGGPDGKSETLVLELADNVTFSTADYIFGMMADQAEAYGISQGFDGRQWAAQDRRSEPGFLGDYQTPNPGPN
jgi:hypothetical protein